MRRVRQFIALLLRQWKYLVSAGLGAFFGVLIFAAVTRSSSTNCPPANRRLLRFDCWDWGDAATWVTGGLTALLVLAAVWPLQEARRDAIWKQARSVPVILREEYPAGLDGDVKYSMTIHNLSGLPIFRVSPMFTAATSWDSMMETPGDDRNLLPGETFELSEKLPPLSFLGVFFMDAADRGWVVTALPSFAHDRLVPYEVFTRLVVRHDASDRARQEKEERQHNRPGG